MSQEVLEGQRWLNSTYGGRAGYISVKEDGLPGSAMSQALVSAMQIELGMGTVTGVFGEQTMAACDAAPLVSGATGNRVKILQYGLYSKGYNPATANGTYTALTESAVKQVQTDAGLSGSQVSGVAKGLQAKAVLGVDEYKLISGGDMRVRSIQQTLNRRYVDYSGLCAADGVYGRSTATQLIYALQAEEGLPVSIANGNFGPTTKTWCPDLGTSTPQYGYGNVQYNASQLADFTKLAQYVLYCVGIDRYGESSGSKYNCGSFDGVFSSLVSVLHAFQSDYGLAQRDMLGLDEWMGLLVSTGNPSRNGTACDCATQLTLAKAQALVGDGYSIVGRYLTGTVGAGANKRPKNITRAEVENIKKAGLTAFCIFQDDADWWQDHDDLSGYFSHSRGFKDAKKAIDAARGLGVPRGEYIYFAVDYDFMEGEVWSKVVPHFRGINAAMDAAGRPYRIGIYSARNTCGIVSAQGLASSSFVSDMSTGYSGNLGYPLPSNWAFDQILEYTLGASDGAFGVDKCTASGRYNGFSTLLAGESIETKTGMTEGVIPNAVGALTAKVASAAALEYYGSETQGDGRIRRTYYAGFSSVANIVENAGVDAKCIDYVKIEAIGADGVTFDPVDPYSEMGNYPPVWNQSSVVPDLVAEAFLIVLEKSLSAITRAGFIVSALVDLFSLAADLDANPPESTTGDSYLMRTYNWSSYQQETAQAMWLNPVFPSSGLGSFKVKYTVHCQDGTVMPPVEIVETK